jgi:hypothetical protein
VACTGIHLSLDRSKRARRCRGGGWARTQHAGIGIGALSQHSAAICCSSPVASAHSMRGGKPPAGLLPSSQYAPMVPPLHSSQSKGSAAPPCGSLPFLPIGTHGKTVRSKYLLHYCSSIRPFSIDGDVRTFCFGTTPLMVHLPTRSRYSPFLRR